MQDSALLARAEGAVTCYVDWCRLAASIADGLSKAYGDAIKRMWQLVSSAAGQLLFGQHT